MATIHLSGSIALFLFGGLIILIGVFFSSTQVEHSILVLLVCIGIFLIGAGVFVATMSKK